MSALRNASFIGVVPMSPAIDPRLVISMHALSRHAKRLRKLMASQGITLTTTQSQEHLAQVFGFKNWHAVRAVCDQAPGANVKNCLKAEGEPPFKPWTSTEGLDDFLARMATLDMDTIHLSPNHIIHGQKRFQTMIVNLSDEALSEAILHHWIQITFQDAGDNDAILHQIHRNDGSKVRMRIQRLARFPRGWDIHIKLIGVPVDLSSLSMPTALLDYLKAKPKAGLRMISGKTGVGKSTTIASIVKENLKHKNQKVITYEEPMEFSFNEEASSSSIIEQGSKTFESISQNVHNSLRRRPSVIVLGECKGPEAIEAAVEAAMVGHTVITSQWARSASHALAHYARQAGEAKGRQLITDIIYTTDVIICQYQLLLGQHTVLLWEYLILDQDARDFLLRNKIDKIVDYARILIRARRTDFLSLAKERFSSDELTAQQWCEIASID